MGLPLKTFPKIPRRYKLYHQPPTMSKPCNCCVPPFLPEDFRANLNNTTLPLACLGVCSAVLLWWSEGELWFEALLGWAALVRV